MKYPGYRDIEIRRVELEQHHYGKLSFHTDKQIIDTFEQDRVIEVYQTEEKNQYGVVVRANKTTHVVRERYLVFGHKEEDYVALLKKKRDEALSEADSIYSERHEERKITNEWLNEIMAQVQDNQIEIKNLNDTLMQASSFAREQTRLKEKALEDLNRVGRVLGTERLKEILTDKP